MCCQLRMAAKCSQSGNTIHVRSFSLLLRALRHPLIYKYNAHPAADAATAPVLSAV